MLNYAGKYCDVCQVAGTVIMCGDTALKTYLEWLTMRYIIGDGEGTAVAAKLMLRLLSCLWNLVRST